jgi:hypothetical protein
MYCGPKLFNVFGVERLNALCFLYFYFLRYFKNKYKKKGLRSYRDSASYIVRLILLKNDFLMNNSKQKKYISPLIRFKTQRPALMSHEGKDYLGPN